VVECGRGQKGIAIYLAVQWSLSSMLCRCWWGRSAYIHRGLFGEPVRSCTYTHSRGL